MKDFISHIEQLTACVSRGRLNLPNIHVHVWLAVCQDPFSDAQRVLDGYLHDPNVDKAAKARIHALLTRSSQANNTPERLQRRGHRSLTAITWWNAPSDATFRGVLYSYGQVKALFSSEVRG